MTPTQSFLTFSFLVFFSQLVCLFYIYFVPLFLSDFENQHMRCRFKQNATKDHMVVAMPSDRSHVPLVEATKSWRKVLCHHCALEGRHRSDTHVVKYCTIIVTYCPDSSFSGPDMKTSQTGSATCCCYNHS